MQLFFRCVQCVCVYVFMRAMQLGLQLWHFAYFVLLNLCTVSSERDSELLSPHHLSTSLFIPSVHSSPILQQLWLSFIGFLSSSLQTYAAGMSVQTYCLNSARLRSFVWEGYLFFWRWVNWGHKQKEAEKPCAVSLLLVCGFADALQVTTAKYFPHVPQSMRVRSWN